MKKLISLLLCFALAFSSFSVVMAADEVEAVTVANADLVAMQAIGIFDSALISGTPMTRRQLSNVYFRILLPDQADDEYIPSNIYFDDILESDFGINMICQMGIMNGVGERAFNPDGNVTYIQLVKTLIDFLGYRQNAEACGGYPTGYAIMASNLGFGKYAPKSLDMVCTTDMAAVLFRLALDVDPKQYIFMDDDGDLHYEISDSNYLELYSHIYMEQGIITSTYVEDVYQYSKTGYFDVRIDDMPMVLSDAVLDMNELLGYKVTYFYILDDNNKRVILHYETIDTDVIELKRDTLDDVKTDTDKIYYYNENNKLKNIDISDAYIFYNGNLCTSYDVTTINPFANEIVDGFIRAVSTDGDPETAEYVFIEAFNSYLVKNIQGKHVINKYHPEIIFLLENIENGEVIIKNVLGEAISPDSVEEYDILNVFQNKDGEITKIIISLDTYVGVVDKITRSNNNVIDTLTIDGQEFSVAANLALNPEYSKLKVGVKLKAMFNHLGEICDITLGDYDETVYGYIIDAQVLEPLSGKFMLNMLTTKNTIEAFEVADNVIINGSKSNVANLEVKLGSPVTPQICRYRLNPSETEISEISFVDNTIDNSQDGFYKYPALASEKPYYRSNSLNGERLLKTSSIVFMVPYYDSDKKNMEMYKTSDPSLFSTEGTSVTMTAAGGHLTGLADSGGMLQFNDIFEMYGTKANNPTAEACVYYIADKDSFGTTDYISAGGLLIVTDIITVLDETEDELKHQITGYVSGALKTYIVEDSVLKNITDGIALDIGDVCQMTVNSAGEIIKLALVFDTSEWKYSSEYTSNPAPQKTGGATGFTNERFFYGTVKYVDDYAMAVEIPPIGLGDPKSDYHVYGSTKFYEYTVDVRGKKSVTMENGSVLRDELNHGIPSKLFMYCDGAVPSFAIVVNQ